jgi:hypothetical protein
MNCKEAAELMSRAMEMRLPWRKRVALRLHLLVCDACTRAARHLRFLRLAARRFGSDDSAVTSAYRLSPEAKRHIANSLGSAR